jgi:hypothetical protein
MLILRVLQLPEVRGMRMAKKKQPTPPVDQDLKKYVGSLCRQIADCIKRDDFTLARRQSNDLLVELAELEAQKRV